jgi:hypothetical protein
MEPVCVTTVEMERVARDNFESGIVGLEASIGFFVGLSLGTDLEVEVEGVVEGLVPGGS